MNRRRCARVLAEAAFILLGVLCASAPEHTPHWTVWVAAATAVFAASCVTALCAFGPLRPKARSRFVAVFTWCLRAGFLAAFAAGAAAGIGRDVLAGLTVAWVVWKAWEAARLVERALGRRG